MSSYEKGVDEACENIFQLLDTESRVVLVGEAGIGKTWLAREICRRAIRKEDPYYITLWLNLNKALDEVSLYENLASQLSVFLEKEEDDTGEDDIQDEEDRITQDLMRLKDKIHIKLRSKGKGKNKTLLVLDDEGSVTNEKKVMTDLYLKGFLAPYRPVKILLTRRKGEEEAIYSNGEIQYHGMVKSDHELDKWSQILLNILTDDYLVDLLKSLISNESLAKLHTTEESWGGNYEPVILHIVRMSMRLPAAVVVLAKSLNYFCQTRSYVLSPYLQEVSKIVIPFSYQFVTAIGCERDTTSRSRENPILRLSYELLKRLDATTKISVVDCFWHSLSLFKHRGCIFYQELIAHWILEGYINPVGSVTKAYMEGHNILMELIKCGLLKIPEDNVVMPEVAMKNLIHLRHHELSGTCRNGLAKICGGDMTKGLGKINWVDDIIEGVRGRKGEKIITYLVSGDSWCGETPEKYVKKLVDLEVFGIFGPKLDSFVPLLLRLTKLRVLVIRDCNLLEDIEEIKALQGLHILEVSGASSLKEISDNFFMAMLGLQSLHFSGFLIKSSPSSISQLKKLQRLIIRDCPLLEDLPNIEELEELEVVDVSGARGLQTCFEKDKEYKSKNLNFYHLQQLQLLDLSESQIDRIPMFQDAEVPSKLHTLTRLLLRNCRKLVRLPNLKPLSGLQILDLSGCTSLRRMLEISFEDKKDLRVLNLSGTNIHQLPSTIEELSSLSNLSLKGCPNLQVLPNIQKLTNLEVFDVSGCTKLHTVEGSFVDMSYLHEVNISGTKVETPEFPKESKIRYLKRIILADERRFQGEEWSQVLKAIENEITENSTSNEPAKSQEISEEECIVVDRSEASP